MRKLAIAFIGLFLISCDPADLQKLLDDIPLSPSEASLGLKEALNFGVDDAVSLLSAKDGYYKSVYKVLLPEEARVVTEKLKVVPGFNQVEEKIKPRPQNPQEYENRGAADDLLHVRISARDQRQPAHQGAEHGVSFFSRHFSDFRVSPCPEKLLRSKNPRSTRGRILSWRAGREPPHQVALPPLKARAR